MSAKARFRKERLLRADRKRHAPPTGRSATGRCEIEIELDVRSPRARARRAARQRAGAGDRLVTSERPLEETQTLETPGRARRDPQHI